MIKTKKRGTESEEMSLERFKRSYQEINEYTKYNYVVVVDNPENSVDKIEAILKAEKCSISRIMDVDLNTEEEIIHDKLIES